MLKKCDWACQYGFLCNRAMPSSVDNSTYPFQCFATATLKIKLVVPTGSRPFRLQTSVSVIHKLHYHGESTEERATRLFAGVNKPADRISIYF